MTKQEYAKKYRDMIRNGEYDIRLEPSTKLSRLIDEMKNSGLFSDNTVFTLTDSFADRSPSWIDQLEKKLIETSSVLDK